MSNITVSRTYGVSPEQVWSVIGDPASIASWHPAIAESPTSGSQRTCILADGGVVKESILARDDAQRLYRYQIDESPLPVVGYVSSVQVSERDGGCTVTWEANFEVVGAPVAEVEAMIQGLYQAGLENLDASLSS